jgi:multiple sugar transport system permease protein
MTGGGPVGSTTTMVMSIYNSAFREYSMGYASAIAMGLGVFIVAIAIGQNLIMARGGKR